MILAGMPQEKSKKRTELDPKELERALEKLPTPVTEKLTLIARKYQQQIEEILGRSSE